MKSRWSRLVCGEGRTRPLAKTTPATESERYLETLGARSFLSLWGYPRPFRDQGGGKEVCDLLVIFDDQIIIFSDKHCVFKDTGRPCLDWRRWFKRAIEASAEQLWGAERWIRENPHRLFLDPRCETRFPLDIPRDGRFYRITVAHGAEDYAQRAGHAGLVLDPSVVGPAHYGENCRPFRVGQIDPARGLVHVFDRPALTAVMQTADTIQDFIDYLRKKEELIESGKLRWAGSEQDLLAVYLGNPHEERSFRIPPRYKTAHVSQGNWAAFERWPLRRAQQRANRISYFWDGLIESYNKHILAGTLGPETSSHNVASNERVLRLLAREPRTKRRELSRALVEFVSKGGHGFRTVFSTEEVELLSDSVAALSVTPSKAPPTVYVFGATPTDPALPPDDQWRLRMIDLTRYCAALKRKYPRIADMIGIAVEAGNLDPESMQMLYLDVREWGAEQDETAREAQERYGFVTNLEWRGHLATHFPKVGPVPNNPRNKPCICGSGLKYKKCCGAGRWQ